MHTYVCIYTCVCTYILMYCILSSGRLTGVSMVSCVNLPLGLRSENIVSVLYMYVCTYACAFKDEYLFQYT